jgi:hypothetical protein
MHNFVPTICCHFAENGISKIDRLQRFQEKFALFRICLEARIKGFVGHHCRKQDVHDPEKYEKVQIFLGTFAICLFLIFHFLQNGNISWEQNYACN